MVTNLFVTVLCMAAVGGAGYGVLKLADLAFGGRMGQGTRCRWAAIVAVAHLVPVHLLWRLVPVRVEAPTVGSDFLGHAAAAAQGAVVGVGHYTTVGTGTVETVKSAAAFGRAEILGVLAAMWLVGACVCALWSLWRFLRARRALMSGGAEAGAELYDAAVDAARELGVRKSPVVRVCPGLGSPTLVGFLRPVVLMPEAELTEGQARMLFAHELTHFKRGDLWKKALMNAVRAVQWYDPAVWMLGRDLEYWIETACDEAVAGSMEKERRREYGYLLIEFATASRPMGVPLGSGRRKLERRIRTMMKSNKKRRAIIGAALAVAVLAGCVGASAVAASYDKGPDPKPSALPEPQRDADGRAVERNSVSTQYDENGEPVAIATPLPDTQFDAGGRPFEGSGAANEYDESGETVPVASTLPYGGNVVTDVDGARGVERRDWTTTDIGADGRIRFVNDADGGLFTLWGGMTASFTVNISDGTSQNIRIDWLDAEGRYTELYRGETGGVTVNYTPESTEKGNFCVWNWAAGKIRVDAAIEVERLVVDVPVVPDVAPDRETLIADDTGVVVVPDEISEGTVKTDNTNVVDVPDDDGGAVPEVELVTELDLSAMGPTAGGELAANVGFVYASAAISEGQSLTVSASYTPAENSMKVGYVDGEGNFVYDTITGGSGTRTFTLDEPGEYKVYISNPSNTGIKYDVSYIVT